MEIFSWGGSSSAAGWAAGAAADDPDPAAVPDRDPPMRTEPPPCLDPSKRARPESIDASTFASEDAVPWIIPPVFLTSSGGVWAGWAGASAFLSTGLSCRLAAGGA